MTRMPVQGCPLVTGQAASADQRSFKATESDGDGCRSCHSLSPALSSDRDLEVWLGCVSVLELLLAVNPIFELLSAAPVG